MSDSKSSKSKSKQVGDIDQLKSEVANFASTLGLSSSSLGFNDTDFRKTGPIKRPTSKKVEQEATLENSQKPKFSKNKKVNGKSDLHHGSKTSGSENGKSKPQLDNKPVPKPPVLTLENGGGGGGIDRFKKLTKLPLVKASNLGTWYVDAEELESRVCGGEEKKRVVMGVREVEKKRELGDRLLWQYVGDYEGSRGQTGDIKMLMATQRSGTAADNVSAFSVMVGDNPVANLRSLDGLLGLVSSKVGKRHALTGFEALKELFISSLLPDRKLKTLVQRPLNKLPENKDGYSLLLFWYFEECLKQRYERFVVALEEASRDMLPILKTKALKTVYSLLTSKSEQEHKLLSALVNKTVVINEVDTFLFRPHLGLRAQYHAVNFLSQIRLSNKGDGPKAAKRLMDVYFALFKAEMFIALLLRAMKNDINLKRVAAFSKRLLQVALQQPPQYACGCLFLLSEVLKARPPLWNTMLQNESIDDDLEHFEDIVEETDNKPSTTPKKEDNNEVKSGNSDSESSEDEHVSPPSDSEADVSDQSEELFVKDAAKDNKKVESLPNHNKLTTDVSSKPSLPGGYDPRHREPSFCNGDIVSWWELTVLASHAHPSVSTMAGTLLSGANIVYNGNPLNHLTLTAFLDKFMEKKPKSSAWHGGSQIEPAKKLDMNNHLIGPEILSLAEDDVPPEDLVFHKFYANKMHSTRKTKKKKKKTAEELYDVDGSDGGDDDDVEGGDESDNEEIDNMLDSSANLSDGEYDYDDLDKVADEDDEDLVGDDTDADVHSDIEGEEFEDMSDGDDDDNDDMAINIGDAAYGDEEEDEPKERKRKRKMGKKAGASPFASLEDYEHLLKDEDDTQSVEETKATEKKKTKSKKKRKSQ